MINIDKIFMGFEDWLTSNIATIANGNPMFYLFQDPLKEIIRNNLETYRPKIENIFNKLADQNGNIDIEKIFNDFTSRLNAMPKATLYNNDSINIVGETGNITLDYRIPWLGNKINMIKCSSTDIDALKNSIIKYI